MLRPENFSLAAVAVIVVATRSTSAQHADARTAAERAINKSALYEDAVGSTYDEWVTVVAYFLVQDPAYLKRFAQSRKKADSSLVALRNDALLHDPADAARHSWTASASTEKSANSHNRSSNSASR